MKVYDFIDYIKKHLSEEDQKKYNINVSLYFDETMPEGYVPDEDVKIYIDSGVEKVYLTNFEQ